MVRDIVMDFSPRTFMRAPSRAFASYRGCAARHSQAQARLRGARVRLGTATSSRDIFLSSIPRCPGANARSPRLGSRAHRHDQRQDPNLDVMGTPTFMSRAVPRRRHVDPRADVYSRGCVLFIGQREAAFRSRSVGEIMAMLCASPPLAATQVAGGETRSDRSASRRILRVGVESGTGLPRVARVADA